MAEENVEIQTSSVENPSENVEGKTAGVESTSESSEGGNTLDELEDTESAGCLGIGFSFIFPLIGFIIYFMKRKEVENSEYYLLAAIAGIFVGILLRSM